MSLKYWVPIILGMYFVSCNYQNKEIRVYKVAKGQVVQIEEPDSESGLHWEVPDSWKPKPASSMHLAAFELPHSEGDASASLMTLSGDGGGILLNVNRWLGQLDLGEVQEDALPGLSRQLEGKSGAFTVFSLFNSEKPEQAFQVAVFDLKEQTLFVKMVAPMQEIETLVPAFEAFCQSIQLHQ